MEQFKQKVGVSGFLVSDGKTLIVKRSYGDSFLPGFWELAGGGLELGENPYTAVEREYLEETNLKVKAISPFHTFSDLYPERKSAYVEIDFMLELDDDLKNLRLSHEHSDFKWISQAEVESYKITEFIKEVIYRGFKEIENKN